jgi:hypothetical protein
MVNEDYSSEGINSYFFIDKLSDYLNDDEIIAVINNPEDILHM